MKANYSEYEYKLAHRDGTFFIYIHPDGCFNGAWFDGTLAGRKYNMKPLTEKQDKRLKRYLGAEFIQRLADRIEPDYDSYDEQY